MTTAKWAHLQDDFNAMVYMFGYTPTEHGFRDFCDEFEGGQESAVEVMWNLQADYLSTSHAIH